MTLISTCAHTHTQTHTHTFRLQPCFWWKCSGFSNPTSPLRTSQWLRWTQKSPLHRAVGFTFSSVVYYSKWTWSVDLFGEKLQAANRDTIKRLRGGDDSANQPVGLYATGKLRLVPSKRWQNWHRSKLWTMETQEKCVPPKLKPTVLLDGIGA